MFTRRLLGFDTGDWSILCRRRRAGRIIGLVGLIASRTVLIAFSVENWHCQRWAINRCAVTWATGILMTSRRPDEEALEKALAGISRVAQAVVVLAAEDRARHCRRQNAVTAKLRRL